MEIKDADFIFGLYETAESGDNDIEIVYERLGDIDIEFEWNLDDCKKYGFIAAGQNPKSSRQLSTLKVGDKIVAYLKGFGYVGVGEVVQEAVHINDFLTMSKKLADLPLTAPNMFNNLDNDHAEFLVKVNWLSAVDREQAKWKPKNGLFTTPLIKASLRNQPKTIKYIELFFDVELSS